MTTGGYGSMRATDADRNNVHAVLQAAYADGRLTWDEFDARSTALLVAKTYNELAVLTTDLRGPVSYGGPIAPYQSPVVPAQRSNTLATVSLAFGVGQVVFLFFSFFGAIVAIACGHAAKSQIKRTGEAGAGMATAGLVLGYLGVIIPLLLLVLAIASSQH
jgi:Domain of unknown function (DUF1707)/Domain of unknown function (DUF4190)